MSGLFITIEGIDSSGKSTQARRLASWLRERGYDVVSTREPGGTDLGGHLRRLLLDGHAAVGPAAEMLLYAADRAQHVEEVIRPALTKGAIVVCERYTDSTEAYQGHGRGLDLEFVQRLNGFAAGGLLPDLTLLLDLHPGLAQERMAKIPDRLEREDPAFHQRVADGYRKLARAHPQRIKSVDAGLPADQVFEQITAIVEERLR